MIPKELLKKIRQIEIRTRRLVQESMAGQYHSAFRGTGMDFEEVREYQPGDEVRAIDWNVTARMNHAFVKKFREERELTVLLLVDLSGSLRFGSGGQSKRELAAEIASVLAFSAVRNQDRVGLVLFTEAVEKYIPPRKGRRHVLRVIRDILWYQPRWPGTSLQGALEFVNKILPHRAVLVVISDFLAETSPNRREILETLGRATAPSPTGGATAGRLSQAILRQSSRKHDVVAVQIDDVREAELPAIGRLRLQDAETGEIREINTNDPRRREMFRTRAARNRQELDHLFNSTKVDALHLRTGEAYDRELTRFFHDREKRRRR